MRATIPGIAPEQPEGQEGREEEQLTYYVPGIPVTEIDHEDQALSKYGGYKVWLFGPNEAKDGWVEMTTGGRAYANDVRNRIK